VEMEHLEELRKNGMEIYSLPKGEKELGKGCKPTEDHCHWQNRTLEGSFLKQPKNQINSNHLSNLTK